MDKHLRTYARKRREDAGQPALHLATRRVLQSEVAKLRQRGGTQGGSFWELLSLRWPRLAFAAALCVALAVGIWSFLPDDNRASSPALMAMRADRLDDAKVLFDAPAPSRLNEIEMEEKLPTADKSLGTTSDKSQTPALRGLTESETRNAIDPSGLAKSKADLDAFGGGGLALGARSSANQRAKLAAVTPGSAPDLPDEKVSEPAAVVLSDSISYSLAPAAGEQRRMLATGKDGAAVAGAERFFFSPTNSRSAGLARRSDGLDLSPAAGGGQGNSLFADAAAAKENAIHESATRAPAPVGLSAGGAASPSGRIDVLALNSPRATAPPTPSAKSREDRARLETELLRAEPSPAGRPERFFKESNPARKDVEQGFDLAAGAATRPLTVDAPTPSASPAPVAPLTTLAPSRSMSRGAIAERQPAPAPGNRGGGNIQGAPSRSESNAALAYRFARVSVAEESAAGFKDTLDRKAPAILERFDFEQSGAGVRLIDSDGSIYAGRWLAEAAMPLGGLAAIRDRGPIPDRTKAALTPSATGKTLEQTESRLAGAGPAATNATFRVSGTNRTSGLLVTFTGSLVSRPASGEELRGFAAPPVQAQRFRREGVVALDAGVSTRLLGRLRISGTNETDFLAAPTVK